MSIEKPANERFRLYERFKESLAKGRDGESDFFDADDLIIIIDQAVDLEDQYVEIEAIMRGYRFFPENEELRSRRGFLYYDLNLDQGVNDIQKLLPEDSPMARILKLRQNVDSLSREEIIAVLDSIIKSSDKLDDESIIQFVDCAAACDCYAWLKDNEKRLRKKTDYLPTLLYELFIVADLQHDRGYCLRLLEELTELEPFNVDFWNALAQILVNVTDGPDPNEPDYEGALATLEYALAIEPTNPQALMLKATVLLDLDRPDEAVEILAPFENNMPSPTMAEIYLRALCSVGNGKVERVWKLVADYTKLWPQSNDLVHIALFTVTPALKAILTNHFQALGANQTVVDIFADRAKTYYSQGYLNQALFLLDTIVEQGAIDYNTMKLLMTCHYCLGYFEECVEDFNDILENHEELLSPAVVVGGLMSYLKLGKKRPAKQALNSLLEKFPLHIRDTWTLASNLESIGMSQFIAAVKTILDTPGPIDVESIDIFNFPTIQQ